MRELQGNKKMQAKHVLTSRAVLGLVLSLLILSSGWILISQFSRPHTTQAASTTSHWLYVVDDGELFIYDIDNNNALLKQVSIPVQGKRGVGVSTSLGLLYVSYCGTTDCGGGHGSLMAYDLVHNTVAWTVNYNFGVDQFAVTPDGTKIYMPHGADSTDGTTSILNASNGQVISTITTGIDGHNTLASEDGSQVYLTGYTGKGYNYADVVNPATNQIILKAGPVTNGIRPFTVNSSHTLMFTTSTNTCGFQVLSLITGALLYTVPFSGSCSWSASNASSHGISLSPDEKRVYVMDAPLDQLEVYDVSGLPSSAPKFVASVQLTSLSGYENPCQTYCEREGWVLNDLSGRYVYVGDAGDVVSTSTLNVVGTLPALQNTRQMIEIDWTNGAISATSTRFGMGHANSIPTPTPTTTTPSPSPTPGTLLAQDTFQRANQKYWGTASDGLTWGGDANTLSPFSIANNTGLISNSNGAYNAVLGPTVTDAEVLFTGSISSFTNNNLGAVLRWQNTNNWYKAYIDGSHLVIQSKVNGTYATLAQVAFTAQANTLYNLRFRIVGSTLYAKAWAASTTEPTNWMATVTSTALASGQCGLRIQISTNTTATITSFQAISA
jgi:hypothetical protein